MTQCGDCMWSINLYDEYKRKAVMTLCPHRVSSLLSWGQRAFPGQRGKLRTGLEARSTIDVSLEISQRVKTQNAYHVQKYFNRWFIFSGFTSDKCSLRHPPVRLKGLAKLKFCKSQNHFGIIFSSFHPCQSTLLRHKKKHEHNLLTHPWRDTESVSASLDCTLTSSVRLPASLESLPCS